MDVCKQFGTLAECRNPKTECRNAMTCGGRKLSDFRSLARRLLASDTPDAKVRVFESLGLRVTFLHTFSPNRPPNEKGGFRIICEDDTGHRWDMQVWMLHAANQYKSTMVDLNGQVVEDASSPMPFTADGSGGDKPNIKPPLWEKAVSALPDGAPHRDIMAWWVLSYGVVLEFTINKDSELFDSDVVNLIVAAA